LIAPRLVKTLKRTWQRAPALALALLCSISAGPASAASTANMESPTEARVIVKFRSAAADSSARARIAAAPASGTGVMQRAQTMGRRHGLALADGNTIAPRTQVLKARGMSSTALAARLAADPEVEYVEVDRRMRAHAAPNDPLYAANASNSPAAGQWYLRPPTAELVASINAQGAWDLTTGRAGIVVAVLDTGVFKEHPDLAGKLLPGYDFISDVGVANDGNGRDADPSDPGDWVNASDRASNTVVATCPDEDSSWHGTQMAGLVGAATDNNLGMAGTGRNIMVLPVRVLGKCGGFVSDIAAGMRWAAGLHVEGVPDNPTPARVINMSLGGAGSCSPTYQNAITAVIQAGAVVVSSGGNEGLGVDMPANCAGVIAVGGVRHSGSKNGFSSLGPEITISAPGGNCVNLDSSTCLYPILSTSNTGTTVPAAATYTDGGVRPAFGTSYASPLVAGTIALMLSVEPTLTPAQIKQLLQSSARPFPAATINLCHAPDGTEQLECNCTTSTCGAGMLDARAAVLAATQPVPALDSGGTGGGALGLGWLAALAGAVATLASQRRRGSAAG
jgi:serine protease